MTDKQIKKFSSSILVSDIKSYIDAHKLEYELYLKEENEEKEEEKNEVHKTKRKQSTCNTVSS